MQNWRCSVFSGGRPMAAPTAGCLRGGGRTPPPQCAHWGTSPLQGRFWDGQWPPLRGGQASKGTGRRGRRPLRRRRFALWPLRSAATTEKERADVGILRDSSSSAPTEKGLRGGSCRKLIIKSSFFRWQSEKHLHFQLSTFNFQFGSRASSSSLNTLQAVAVLTPLGSRLGASSVRSAATT